MLPAFQWLLILACLFLGLFMLFGLLMAYRSVFDSPMEPVTRRFIKVCLWGYIYFTAVMILNLLADMIWGKGSDLLNAIFPSCFLAWGVLIMAIAAALCVFSSIREWFPLGRASLPKVADTIKILSLNLLLWGIMAFIGRLFLDDIASSTPTPFFDFPQPSHGSYIYLPGRLTRLSLMVMFWCVGLSVALYVGSVLTRWVGDNLSDK